MADGESKGKSPSLLAFFRRNFLEKLILAYCHSGGYKSSPFSLSNTPHRLENQPSINDLNIEDRLKQEFHQLRLFLAFSQLIDIDWHFRRVPILRWNNQTRVTCPQARRAENLPEWSNSPGYRGVSNIRQDVEVFEQLQRRRNFPD